MSTPTQIVDSESPVENQTSNLTEVPGRISRQDLRLVPAAITLWSAALFGLLLGWWAAVVCGGLAGLVALVLIARSPVLSRRFAAGVGLLVCGALAAGPVALELVRAEHDQLRGPAARGTTTVVRGVVADRARPVRSVGYGDQQAGTRSVVLAVDAEQVSAAGQPVESTGRVLLIAPVERWAQLLPGQRVTATGSLAAARGPDLTAAVVYVRGPPIDVGLAPWWQRAAESMRAGLRQVTAGLGEEPAGLLPGLAVGDTSALPSRVEQEFIAAGMSHLTAVSGSNVAITCGAVLFLFRWLRAGPRFSAAAAGLALVGFGVLVGPEPSVLRACVMGGVGLLALALGRTGSALSALALAVCGLVLYDPAMAANFGFALSVLATGGLVLLAPRWADGMIRRGVPAGYAEGLAIPLAAFVVTAPVIVGMAGRLSLVSVLANVLAAPVVAAATVLSVLATLVATFWPSAAHLLLLLAEPEAEWLILVARYASRIPGAVLPWPAGWWGGALVAFLLLALVLALRHRKLRVGLAALLAVVLLVAIPVQVVAPSWPPTAWATVACDVGQGDAVVLATGEPGRAVVVDTGPETGPVDECLDRLKVDRIPLVIISHLHADHIGGLSSVFAGRAVGAVAVGPGRAPNWAWRRVSDEAAHHGVPLLELSTDERLAWPGLGLEVLGPRYMPARQLEEQDGTAINNTSLVLRADTPAGRVLLTGDVELAAQADLVATGVDLRAEILKVPHHGSRFTLPGFVSAVQPRIAMVTVGAGNTYGHPNKTTMDTLVSVGALVTRTDADGDTAVVADSAGPAVVRRGQSRGPPK